MSDGLEDAPIVILNLVQFRTGVLGYLPKMWIAIFG
jgi:hypothetical protein